MAKAAKADNKDLNSGQASNVTQSENVKSKGGTDKNADKGGSSDVSNTATLSQYFKESVQELKRVSYPTKAEAIQATVVAIFIMAFMAICIFLLDLAFGSFMHAIL